MGDMIVKYEAAFGCDTQRFGEAVRMLLRVIAICKGSGVNMAPAVLQDFMSIKRHRISLSTASRLLK